MSPEATVLTTHWTLPPFGLYLVVLYSLLITTDVALKRWGFGPLPFLLGVVHSRRGVFAVAFIALVRPRMDPRQALSETASSSGMAGTLGGGKSRVDKRCQGRFIQLKKTLLQVWNYLGHLTFHSVLGQNPA